MQRLLQLAVCLLAWAAQPSCAASPEAYIYVDVGFKIFVKSNGETSPKAWINNGTTPVYFNPVTDQTEANNLADEMLQHATDLSVNSMMDYNWRGLRYRRYGDVEFIRADVTPIDATLKSRIDSLFRSSYAAGTPGDTAYNTFDPAGKIATWANVDAASKTTWKWYEDRSNFYLVGGFGGGVGYGPPTNLMVQGGLWTNPATHELGHWFSLPHTFRIGSAPAAGVCYWGDQDAPAEHGDGFTDTLVDHVGGVQSLDDNASFIYHTSYAALTASQQLVIRNRFLNYYAMQFFGAASYDDLTISQKLRIPPYDNAAPAPTSADYNRLAVHIYGVNFSDLVAGDQAGIINAVANPDAAWWIKNARWGVWYCKVDDDLIATHDFNSKFYDELDAWEADQVRLLNANIMAYRAGKGSPFGLLSEQQLDRMCDLISQNTNGMDRSPTRGWECGKYIFFGGPTTDWGAPVGSSLNSHATITSAHTAATGRDILIGRPGTYPVPGPNGTELRLNKAVTLRATKDGAFTIYGH